MYFDEDVLVPIVPCPRCGQRFVINPNRDGRGDRIPLPEEEEMKPPKCDECSREAFGEAFDADWQDAAERILGLAEEDMKTLQALKSIIENPDRLYMVVQVHGRVDELERRLEDRVSSLRDSFEAKLEEVRTRLFFGMLIVSVLTFLLGLAIGVVMNLVFGVL